MNKLMKNRLHKSKGFTLVELIVAIVILGILVAIAVPSLIGYIDRAREVQRAADARSAAQAVMSMFLMEGVDPTTASQSSFYSSGDYTVPPADRVAIVADLLGVPVSDIGFSVSGGQWRALGDTKPEIVIHLTNNPNPNITQPGATRLWDTKTASDSETIFLCILVGETGYYRMQLK